MTTRAGLACFSGEVLSVYRRRHDCRLRRTDSAGRLETARWSLRFRLGPGDTLLLPERELWKLAPAELSHWLSFQLLDGQATGSWMTAETADGPERPWP